ncbi:hypothetical protein [Aggregatibacter kilianii]|uniref:hypothetical protein n=1 Tax=Aggregatibacter kilianii TaxID=2025884 RepID=UPI0019550402|nr:hypothetical protein [Aggregatibacter kilianii]
MNATKDLILKILEEIDAQEGDDYSKGYPVSNVPTLEENKYRNITPMLKARFELLSYLIDATHGDWLSIDEMKLLWSETIPDERLQEIKTILYSHIENWENNAGALFKKDRLSLFAGSAYTNEHIYLLWLDGIIEPELWVYDTNGEARYKNLDEYLIAYINDDLSQYEKKWIL